MLGLVYTLQQVINSESLAELKAVADPEMLTLAQACLDSLYSVEVGDFVATAMVRDLPEDLHVSLAVDNDGRIEMSCSCGSFHCPHTLALCLMVHDVMEARLPEEAQECPYVQPLPAVFSHDSLTEDKLLEKLNSLSSDELASLVRVLMHKNPMNTSTVINSLIMMEGSNLELVVTRAHDAVTRATRFLKIGPDPEEAAEDIYEASFKLMDLNNPSTAVAVLDAFRRLVWHALSYAEDQEDTSIDASGLTDTLRALFAVLPSLTLQAGEEPLDTANWVANTQLELDTRELLNITDYAGLMTQPALEVYLERIADAEVALWRAQAHMMLGHNREALEICAKNRLSELAGSIFEQMIDTETDTMRAEDYAEEFIKVYRPGPEPQAISPAIQLLLASADTNRCQLATSQAFGYFLRAPSLGTYMLLSLVLPSRSVEIARRELSNFREQAEVDEDWETAAELLMVSLDIGVLEEDYGLIQDAVDSTGEDLQPLARAYLLDADPDLYINYLVASVEQILEDMPAERAWYEYVAEQLTLVYNLCATHHTERWWDVLDLISRARRQNSRRRLFQEECDLRGLPKVWEIQQALEQR